ncbi:hypothetical protein BKA70DRAFT_1404051 [Coprinopsis sp. MPI-PUGE-AT-0042]|nr:hypothetical protein BKA70DRAFT_1404051 [Coprinopsis sp. MPI-PUGE-AT-0042]
MSESPESRGELSKGDPIASLPEFSDGSDLRSRFYSRGSSARQSAFEVDRGGAGFNPQGGIYMKEEETTQGPTWVTKGDTYAGMVSSAKASQRSTSKGRGNGGDWGRSRREGMIVEMHLQCFMGSNEITRTRFADDRGAIRVGMRFIQLLQHLNLSSQLPPVQGPLRDILQPQ